MIYALLFERAKAEQTALKITYNYYNRLDYSAKLYDIQ